MTPQRITLSRAKGWRKPAGAVIVARPSIWGNPWGIGSPGTVDLVLDGVKTRYQTGSALDAHDAVGLFAYWLRDGSLLPIQGKPEVKLTTTGQQSMRDHLHGRRKLILSRLHELRGHDLCCWCKQGQPCHADVLLQMANGGEG